MQQRKIRILLTRSLLEGHDMGIRMIANKCRDSGFEVIYTRFSDIKEIVKSAGEEAVDIIGLTSSSVNYFYLASELLTLLKDNNMEIPVIFGGVIPTQDVPRLIEIGVKKIFGPGSTPDEAVKFVSDLLSRTS